jgi:hypothetical protein
MAMELKTKNQWLAPQANCFPLASAPNVKVVLRHFHWSHSGAARCGSFVGKAFSLLVVSSR